MGEAEGVAYEVGGHCGQVHAVARVCPQLIVVQVNIAILREEGVAYFASCMMIQ